jgi:hypothetical protein
VAIFPELRVFQSLIDFPCGKFSLNNLLHPERAFAHPHDVVSDPDLTVNEKRAILASWASDASAVEAAPALRLGPGCSRPVPVDDILDALRALDNEAHGKAVEASWLRRQVRRRSIEPFRARRRSEEDPGHGLAH